MIWQDDDIIYSGDESEIPFDKTYKTALLCAMEKEIRGEGITYLETCMIFHYVRHAKEARYKFVPRRYKVYLR